MAHGKIGRSWQICGCCFPPLTNALPLGFCSQPYPRDPRSLLALERVDPTSLCTTGKQLCLKILCHMGLSENRGYPQIAILMGKMVIFHWNMRYTIFRQTHIKSDFMGDSNRHPQSWRPRDMCNVNLLGMGLTSGTATPKRWNIARVVLMQATAS